MEIANFIISLLPQLGPTTKAAILISYIVCESILLYMAVYGTVYVDEKHRSTTFGTMCAVAADGRYVNRYQLTYWLAGISLILLLFGLIHVIYAMFIYSAIGHVQGLIYRTRIQKYEQDQEEKHRKLRAEASN